MTATTAGPVARAGRPEFEHVRPGGYQPALDGLRALAVLAIVAFHARQDLVPGAYIGVDLFFVISGFLITGILLREFDRSGRINLPTFYARRALRLMPALALLCGVLAVAFLLLPDAAERTSSLVGVATAATYTSSVVAASGASDLGAMIHTWSLSVEEYFYLVWPLALIAVARLPRRRLEAVAGLAGLAITYKLVVAYASGWSDDRLYFAADTRAEELIIGCLLAVLVAQGRARVRTWQVVGVAAVLTAYVVVPGDLNAALYRGGGSTLVAVACAVVVAGLVHRPGERLARLLSTRPLVWVGRRSYGIYLWNLPLVTLVPVLAPAWIPVLPTVLLLSLVVPALSYRWVEEPFLRRKRRLSSDRVERPVSAVSG